MKLSTLTWFLRNPQFLGQAGFVLKRRLFDKPERYKEDDAIQWCESLEKPEGQVLDTLGVQLGKRLSDVHADYMKYGEVKANEAPVQMGGPGGLEVIYQIASHFKPSRAIETGVAYGWSSLAILLGMRASGGKLFSVDMPYVNMNNEPFVGTVVHPDLRKNWTLIRKADRQGIPEALGILKTLDFVHYDSDKSYSGRHWAYPRLWAALELGGIFISDDIQDNIAFKEFCERLHTEPLIFKSDEKFVGVIVKG